MKFLSELFLTRISQNCCAASLQVLFVVGLDSDCQYSSFEAIEDGSLQF